MVLETEGATRRGVCRDGSSRHSWASRVYLVLSTSKSGTTVFSDAVQYLTLGSASSTVDDASASVSYAGGWGHASGEAGMYSGTNSYSDVAGDTATLSFTGTGITLHAVTAPNHGIAGISVDGGSETLVDEYSAARTGDVAVWTSSGLAAGTHIIRVRVTGTQRAGATGKWVTVDRFEFADQPVAGENYRILNRNSGKPLAVAGGSAADGAQVVQQTGGVAWTVTPAGDAYTLSYTGSGKMLDVNGSSSSAGLQLQQWSATGGANQQWQLVAA